MGWNLAVGGISDILASGGKPIFYGQSLVVKNDWKTNDIKKLTQGIKSILNITGIHFIGGDFGIQDDWTYTAVVIGVPDKDRGEIVKAYVKTNAEPTEALKKELQEYVKMELSKHEYPREIEFVDDIPKTEGGKTNRKEIKYYGIICKTSYDFRP